MSSVVLLETAAFKLEREHEHVPVANPKWTLTVKTPDSVVVIGKAGMVRLFEVISHERGLIAP